jgi:UDP-N-acetylglucosamine 3-dehydrogenase
MLNIGIIGLGHIGELHMKNCMKIDDINIIAVTDQSEKALKRAKSLGIKHIYNDYHDLFDASLNIDAVIISLPNYLHFENIQLALKYGLNVFVEKPMANTIEECREIMKLSEKSGKKLMIGHCMRFYEVVEKMKDKESKGHIGDLEVVTIEAIMNGPFTHGLVPKPVPEWWFDPKKAGGGALLDIGYHIIDLFRFFAGDSKIIFSSLDYKYNLPIEDGAILILQSLNSSTKGIINIGWYQKTIFPKYNFRIILHGNAGYLSSDDLVPKNMYIHAIKEGIKNPLKKIAGKKIRPLSYTYYYESFYKELIHFFNCIKNDRDTEITALDGLKTMEIIEEAYKLANQKRFSE